MGPMSRKPRVLEPGAGRTYRMGRMTAVFKADGDETKGASSISEWWLEANTQGPPAHAHPEDHVYYVIEGTLAVCFDGEWCPAGRGSYVLIPGGTGHTFENRGSERVGLISFNTPGGFERDLPSIVEWFEENPLGDAG